MPNKCDDSQLTRVLVAEDNLISQMLAVSLLAQLGYAADIASNGRAAVEAVERHTYAAVLMDCQMPELDGIAATQRIRAREGQPCSSPSAAASSRVPIIALTANDERDRCLAAGMDDFIAKPLDIETLRGVLNRCVDPRRNGCSLKHPG
jgi:two-component system, sensor histidine kinase and response regulator